MMSLTCGRSSLNPCAMFVVESTNRCSAGPGRGPVDDLGNMNTVPAIATAFYESIGMLVLVGVGATHWFDRGGIEEFYRARSRGLGRRDEADHARSPLMVTRPDTAIDMFLRAYQTAHSGRPGPVVMAIPFDIQNTLIPDDLPDPTPYMAHRPPGPDPQGVARRDRAASRPPSARRSSSAAASPTPARGTRCSSSPRRPASRSPTTPSGKAAFPEDHRLSLGCIGRAGTGQGNYGARQRRRRDRRRHALHRHRHRRAGRCSTSRPTPSSSTSTSTPANWAGPTRPRWR